MTALLFVAGVFLLAALATVVLCVGHGMPLGWTLTSRPLRLGTMIVGVPALVGGVILWLFVRDWGLAAIGAAAGALPSLRYVHRARKRAARFADHTIDDAAAAKIVSELSDKKPAPGDTSLGFEVEVVTTAQQLVAKNRYDAAAKLIDLLEWKVIEGPTRVAAATLLSICCLRSGLTARAREALERCRGVVHEHGDRDHFEVLDAAILVHEGKLAQALERLDEIEAAVSRKPELRLEALVARTHAVAGRGDDDAALRLVADLRRDYGADALRCFSFPEGPATALAAQLGGRSAYR